MGARGGSSLGPRQSILFVIVLNLFAGLCLEKVPPQAESKFGRKEWLEQIKRCYELASDLGILYLQQQDKLHVSNSIITSSAGILMLQTHLFKCISSRF